MAIPEHILENLRQLEKAFNRGEAAIVECTKKSNSETVFLLCAIGFNGTEYEIVPFAEMVNDNPFDIYEPPE